MVKEGRERGNEKEGKKERKRTRRREKKNERKGKERKRTRRRGKKKGYGARRGKLNLVLLVLGTREQYLAVHGVCPGLAIDGQRQLGRGIDGAEQHVGQA